MSVETRKPAKPWRGTLSGGRYAGTVDAQNE